MSKANLDLKQPLYNMANDNISTFNKLIKDAEWRLGSYLASDTTSKSDPYAQRQIKLIRFYSAKVEECISIVAPEAPEAPYGQ